jgi:predicted Rossmann fold nucleotide-binding protein DprA/Smf involved in DNA uptake
MTRVGITGHRDLSERTHVLVTAALATELATFGQLSGISSLAEGADQIFAEEVLKAGGALTAVIPSAEYGRSFETSAGKATYRRLRSQAEEVITLPFPAPSEEAFWAAGRQVVGLADVLLAVWDGSPSGGVGGTADVVAFAGRHGVPTIVLWPPGSCRRSSIDTAQIPVQD